MANFYKKMIKVSFRGNTPRISDEDDALTDPYKSKSVNNERGTFELNTPGDQSATGFGTDYYTDHKQPPKGISEIEDRALREPYGTDFDGNDPNLNDKYPLMEGSSNLFDDESPLSRSAIISRKENGIDRDNTSVGPHNQSSKTENIFDNIRRRIH
jgi:hypothetical protein